MMIEPEAMRILKVNFINRGLYRVMLPVSSLKSRIHSNIWWYFFMEKWNCIRLGRRNGSEYITARQLLKVVSYLIYGSRNVRDQQPNGFKTLFFCACRTTKPNWVSLASVSILYWPLCRSKANIRGLFCNYFNISTVLQFSMSRLNGIGSPFINFLFIGDAIHAKFEVNLLQVFLRPWNDCSSDTVAGYSSDLIAFVALCAIFSCPTAITCAKHSPSLLVTKHVFNLIDIFSF